MFHMFSFDSVIDRLVEVNLKVTGSCWRARAGQCNAIF